MKKSQLTTIGLLLAVVLFFALNIAANVALRSLRADLTQDKIFTLEEGSKKIARDVEEPINLYFYLSRGPARQYPDVLDYSGHVLDTLREYERASGGNIHLTVIDPEPFSEEEDQAVAQGIQGAPLPDGGVLYFGLVGTSSTDAKEAIPFFVMEEEKQRTLEYDLSKLIWTLAHPTKKKVGILTALSLEGGGGNPMFGQQQSEPAWPFLDQIGDFFDVQVLGSTAESLKDIDVLMVIHPRGFTDETLYQIDQWALAGKPLIVFVDPQCDVDPGASEDPSNPMSRFMAKKDSDLEKLFKPWGFELAKNKVVCDDQLAVRQRARAQNGRGGGDEIPYVYLLRLGKESASPSDPVTRLLGNLLTVTAGSLRKLPDGATTFTPILESSERSAEVDAAKFQFADPQALLASFTPDYKGKMTLGARVTGNVKTAFPDGKPGAPKPDAAEGETPPATPAEITESTAPLNLLVFSDVDMLHDRLWFRQLGQYPDGKPFGLYMSENVDLLKNSIDSVSGGEQLASIRVRGTTLRPFDRVQEIQRDADQRFLARNQELERKLQDAERRLNELQKAKGEGSEELVTAEQRKEEEKVREEFVQTRRDLRSVKLQLHQDIEHLGSTLKWLNILLMPLIVCTAAVALGAMRGKQRARK